MATPRARSTTLTALAFLLATQLWSQVNPRMVNDDAIRRAEATKEWYGSVATPEYLDYRDKVADQQLKLWESRIPGTKAYRDFMLGNPIPARLWNNIGPLRGQAQLYRYDSVIADTGRPTVILPHPTNANLLYVGFAGGGLWKCANADVAAAGDWTWEPITDALPAGSPAGNLSIGGAAFRPEDPNTIYLALGDATPGGADGSADGRGVWITTDGGSTWTRGGTAGATTRVKTLLALPGNIVLVAGNGGLFRSTDGAATFTQVTLPAAAVAHDIIKLANGDLVVSYNGGVAYSTDQGATWTAATYDSGITTPGMRRIALAANGSTVYGLFQNSAGGFPKGIMKSTDGGRTFVYVGSAELFNVSGDGSQAGYNHFIAVDPVDANKVFVATNLSMYRSTNGGVNWTRLSQWMGGDRTYIHADFHVHAWAPTGAKTLYVGNDGGLSIIRNPDITSVPVGDTATGGTPVDLSFVDPRRNKGVATHLIYHIGSTTATTPAGSRDKVLIGLQDMGTRLRSVNDASQTYDMVIGGDGFGSVIHPYNGNKMIGSLYNTRIQYTTDGGVNWYTATGIGTESTPFFTRVSIDMTDPTGETVYTFSNTKIYRSTNFGATWTALPTAPTLVGYYLRWVAAAGNRVVAQAADQTFISNDGGNTWTTRGASFFPGSNPTPPSFGSVTFDPSNSQVMYATSVRFSSTVNHIWKTVDGGATWTAMDTTTNGFPFGVPVHMAKADPFDANTVYAGTDLGLYRTTNGGTSWERFGTGLPMVSVRDIYIAPDGSFMRVGTHGRGVWEMQGVTDAFAPVFTSHPSDISVYAGATAIFGAVANGNPAPTFQWQVSTDAGSTWNNVSSGTGDLTNIYTTTATTLADSGKRYRVLATNSVSTTHSNGAQLTVLTPVAPQFTTHPGNATVAANYKVTFTCAATGGPAPVITWQTSPDKGMTWTNVPGATGTSLTFTPQYSDNGRYYRAVATNTGSTVYSNTATLTVTPQLLVNPAFDNSTTDPFQSWIVNSSGYYTTAAHTVPNGVLLGYFAPGMNESLQQEVTIPSNASTPSLSFWMRMLNYTTPTSPINHLHVRVTQPDGTVLATLASYDNTSPITNTWTKMGPFDLSAFKGQTVRILFNAPAQTATPAAGQGLTRFYLDTVSVDHALPPATKVKDDIDGNGYSDLVWYNDQTGQVFGMLNQAGDAHSIIHTEPDTAWSIIAKADFDGDGKTDLLWRNSTTGQVYRMLLNGLTIKGGEIIHTEPDPHWKIIAAKDLDKDGKAELLWYNDQTGVLYFQATKADMSPEWRLVHTEPDLNWKVVALADFDGNGYVDLLWRNSSTGAVFFMDGNNNGLVHTEADPAWTIAGTEDYSGDGKADILWYNTSTGMTYLMEMNGKTITNQGVLHVEPDTKWKIVAQGDFNADGRTDLIWRNADTGQVYAMLVNGINPTTGAVIHTEPDAHWQIISTLDYSGDGKSDLLWYNDQTGMLYLMILNGASVTGGNVGRTEPDTHWRVVTK